MDLSLFFGGAVALLVIVVLLKTARVVPQREQFVIERLGKYSKTLDAGFHLLVPFVDVVAYKHTLKEQTLDVPSQSCITKDNISVEIDGVIYMQVNDARAASYGIENYVFATSQLAQTTLRSEIGKIELDRTFEERVTINAQVVEAVDRAAEPWGVKILRYEIKDIVPPNSIMEAMEAQMKAERVKRAQILESEGDRQANINVAEGKKQAQVLAAEADKAEQILRAEGEATAITTVAEAQANALLKVGEAADTEQGQKAIQLDLATKAISAKEAIARESSVVLLPDNATDASSMVAQGMAIINSLNKQNKS